MNNILLSIDGSTTNTGYSLFNIDTKELISYNCISPINIIKNTTKTTKIEKKENKIINMTHRVNIMIQELTNIITSNNISVIIMEDTYGQNDMLTYKKLCQLQGAIISIALLNNIQIIFKTPSVWRKSINIPLSENKKRLTRIELKQKSIDYIKDKFNIIVSDDEADSICLGLSYLYN